MALNIVLSEFRSQQFGNLPTPSKHFYGRELIFISNEQWFVASSHIQNHIAKSKRKPDIIAAFTSALHRTHGDYKDLAFEDWVCRDAKRGKYQALSPQLQWSDIHQSWDLDISSRFVPEFASDKLQNEVEQANGTE